MTLHIGMVVGGDSADNASTVATVKRMSEQADRIDDNPASDVEFDLTFEIAGPVWQPKFRGVRPGRIAAGSRSAPVRIAVPERFPTLEEGTAYLETSVWEALAAVEETVRKRKLDWSLVEVRQAIGTVLQRTLQTGRQSDTRRPEVRQSSQMDQDASPAPEQAGHGRMVKLYSRKGDSLDYWEAWNDGSNIVIHEGTVGDRGRTRAISLGVTDVPSDVMRTLVEERLHAGFGPIDEDEQARLVVAYPSRFRTAANIDEVWATVQRALNEELGWLGLGRCVNVDYSGQLTFMVVALDSDRAVAAIRSALERGRLLDGGQIGVETEGRYLVAWPEDMAGTELST